MNYGLAPLGPQLAQQSRTSAFGKEEPKKGEGEALKLGLAAVAGMTVVGIALVWGLTRK